MKRLQLVLAVVLLLCGCDDAEVLLRVSSVLENGGIAAQVRCFDEHHCLMTEGGPPTCWSYGDRSLVATRFQDGSASVQGSSTLTVELLGWLKLYPRNDADADDLRLSAQAVSGDCRLEDTVTGGFWDLDAAGACSGFNMPHQALHKDLADSDCSGFNLEAFGVTP